jgi:hypothetical protein
VVELELTYEELESSGLPAVCMRCGRPTSLRISQTFAWSPPGGLWTKKKRLDIPTCSGHRFLVSYLPRILFVLILLVIPSAVVWGELCKNQDPMRPAYASTGWGWFLLGHIFSVILLCIAVLAQRVYWISENFITDKSIGLQGVSEKFVETLQRHRWKHGPGSRWGPAC